MRLRTDACIATAAVGLQPGTAPAQLATRMHRLGYMTDASGFRRGFNGMLLGTAMRDLGYVEGQNFVLVSRSPGSDDRLPESAAELVQANVDVMFPQSILLRVDRVFE